jgi:glycosyltransferase involved in cell wall biosynthesis
VLVAAHAEDVAMTRRLKIGHLTTVDMSLVLLLRKELAEDRAAGFDVYGLSAPGPYVETLHDDGVTHVPLPFSRRWDPVADVRAFLALWREIRRLRLDVLHTHTPKAGILGRLAGRLAGVPVVVNTVHGLWLRDTDRWTRRSLVLLAEACASLFSHAELYQNDEDRRRLSWAVSGTKARTVGNGIDLERFRRDQAGRRRVRDELGLPPETLLVGGVGRLVQEKGVEEFAEVARRLRDRAHFVWVGPVEDGSDALMGGLEGVRFLGARLDMPDVYSALDIFVLPTHREGFSRSGMEAAACGCAIVLTDIRGCREVGTHGKELLLVPPRDVDALHAAVLQLLDDRALRDRLSGRAAAHAQLHFDQRRVARLSIETYRAVAESKGLEWPS